MKCYKCGKGMSEVKAMYPIDPTGKGRRWACDEHIGPDDVPEDVRDIVNAISDQPETE